jgi:CTP:molybdopterin cytidylyltransferase MocA
VAALLAAGAGSRFGGGKLAAPLAGRPLAAWAASAALGAGAERVLVVVPPGGRELATALPPGPELVVNPRAARGMGTSLAAAASRARELGAAVLVVLLADMPLIGPELVRRVWRAALEAPAGAAAAACGGRRGHPAAFAARWLEELAGLDGDAGARGVLERLGPELALVPAGPECLLDVDTPADLARAEELCRARGGG